MREVAGNIWELAQPGDCVGITTNGYFSPQTGKAVMGRGVALQAAQRYPNLPYVLGHFLKYGRGNSVRFVPGGQFGLFMFPVKHHWKERADLDLIDKSCRELHPALVEFPDCERTYWLPRPGCGNGSRDWETEVKPILMKHFEHRDNLIVVSLPEGF